MFEIGKFVIAIDEMLPEVSQRDDVIYCQFIVYCTFMISFSQGFYETNDVESLLKASKLKNH